MIAIRSGPEASAAPSPLPLVDAAPAAAPSAPPCSSSSACFVQREDQQREIYLGEGFPAFTVRSPSRHAQQQQQGSSRPVAPCACHKPCPINPPPPPPPPLAALPSQRPQRAAGPRTARPCLLQSPQRWLLAHQTLGSERPPAAPPPLRQRAKQAGGAVERGRPATVSWRIQRR